jgi:NodT family efflux transporter outer membrane factor (OMF) lipoprotein
VRAAPAICMALLLAGCTVGPNYRAPELSRAMPQQFGEATTGTEPSPELNGWWRTYNDPELERLVQLALAGNPDIAIAISRIAESRAAERVTRAGTLPEVDAQGGTDYERFSKNAGLASLASLFGGGAGGGSSGGGIAAPGDHIQTYSLGFDASWEIDLFGGNARKLQGAAARREQAVWNARDAQLSLVAEVADTYLQLRALQEREAIARGEVDRQQRYLQIAQHTAQAGLLAQGDYVRQRADLANAQAAIGPIVAQGKAEIHALGALTGQTPDALIVELSQPRPQLAVPPAVPPGLPADLLRRRPDVRAAERSLAAATADIGVAVSDLFPKIDLMGMAQLISTGLGNLFTADSAQITASAAATFPVLDFGRRRGQIEERRAEADQAYFQYKKVVLGALRDVEDALIRVRADDQQRLSLAAGVADSRTAVASTEAHYEAGLTDYGDVLLARQAVLSGEDNLATAESNQRRDLVSLYKALGGGWEDLPLTEVKRGATAKDYTQPPKNRWNR